MDSSLPHLRAFYEVAVLGSITAGAKKSNVSQPALSRSIQKLEQALGQQLLVRKPRGIILTPKGRSVFERCKTIFQECDAIYGKKALSISRLQIAVSENLGIHILPQVLTSLKRTLDHEVKFVIATGTAENVIQQVLNNSVDLGYCYHAARNAGIQSEPIANVRFRLIAPRKWALKNRDIRSLSTIPLIGSRTRDYQGPYAARSLLNQAGLGSPEVKVESNSQEAQAEMVAEGLGYALVPWFVARPRLKRLAVIPTRRPLTLPIYRISRTGENEQTLWKQIDHEISKQVELE